ncbi:MAG: hypothetical protein HQL34_08070, partial [Alphaproteobacteria bacterium]|nr:hypothetical protein [Alphaproteobacteria bacterium]
FGKRARELVETSEETQERLRGMFDALRQKADELSVTGDRLGAQADQYGKVFDRQVTEIVKASKAAEQQVLILERARSEAGVERFLQSAAFIVERLQSLAVDVSRVYQTNVDEEMWKKFYKGDQAVFLRHLLRGLSKSDMQVIKNRFEEDSEFREFVSRYLAEFENLLGQVRTCDRPDVLTAAFTSSDVGKLYLTLAKALGRLD